MTTFSPVGVSVVYRWGIGGIRIIGAVVAVATAVLSVGVVDRVGAVRAAILPVRVTGGICVVLIGTQVAEVFSGMTINQYGWIRISQGSDCQEEYSRDKFHGFALRNGEILDSVSTIQGSPRELVNFAYSAE